MNLLLLWSAAYPAPAAMRQARAHGDAQKKKAAGRPAAFRLPNRRIDYWPLVVFDVVVVVVVELVVVALVSAALVSIAVLSMLPMSVFSVMVSLPMSVLLVEVLVLLLQAATARAPAAIIAPVVALKRMLRIKRSP
jgi:hypothetical protein